MTNPLIPRAIAAAIASICLAAVPAAASAVDVVAGPDNAVLDVVTSDNGTSYVTGGFSAFGWYDTKGIAVADATTGQIDPTFPQVRGGSVRVTTPDGTGGWYLGGDFTTVGGVARAGLAHVLADGSLDAAWDPVATFYGGPADILSIVPVGNTVFIAGGFTSVNGQSRAGLAAISTGGTVTGWDPNVGAPSDPGRSFDTLAASPDGQTIYVGGGFTRMGAVSGLANLAAVRADGSVSGNWKPQITSSGGGPPGGPVKTIAPTGDRVYVGGFFDQVGADARSNVAALDAATGAAISAWAPSVDNLVNTLAVTTDGSIAYMGGTFTNVNNTPRTRLAAVGQNGILLPWAPNPGASVKTIAVNDAGTHVVARGPLTFFGTPFVSDFAPDGTLNWNMGVNDASLVWSTGFWCGGTRLTVGGAFASWNGQTARGVATLALDGTPMANPLATCSHVPPAPGTGGGSTPTTPTDGTGASAPQPTTTPAAQPGRLRFSGRPRTQSRTIAVRVVAPGPGRLTVRGTWTTGEMATRTGCTGTVTVRAAGAVRVPCRLNADVLTARQRRSVVMRLNTEFTGTSGGTAVGATALRLNRAALRLAVTG